MTGRLDVTSEKDFAATMAAFAQRSDGHLDVMFNNAGIAPGGWFEDMPMDTIRQMVDINIYGVIHGIRAALPLLKQTPGSLCISTSSSCATYGHALRAVYSASKYAVKGLTEALSLEFEQHGVRTADCCRVASTHPCCVVRCGLNGSTVQRNIVRGMPKTGPYRLMPVTAIADTVWDAYSHSGDDPLVCAGGG